MNFKPLALMAILVSSSAAAEYIPKYDPYWKVKTFGWMLDVSKVDKFDESQQVEAYISDRKNHYILGFSCTEKEMKAQLAIEGDVVGYSWFNILDVHSGTILLDGENKYELTLDETYEHSRVWTINDGYFDSGPNSSELALMLAASESMDLRLYDNSGNKLDMSFPVKINQQNLKHASSLCHS